MNGKTSKSVETGVDASIKESLAGNKVSNHMCDLLRSLLWHRFQTWSQKEILLFRGRVTARSMCTEYRVLISVFPTLPVENRRNMREHTRQRQEDAVGA